MNTDESSSRYTPFDPVDLDNALINRVFELYERTYRALGEPFLKEPYALLKYNRWILFYSGDAQNPDNLIACALFDVTPCGVKGRFKASDLSPDGRTTVKEFSIASYNARSVFGAISDKLEAAILDKVRVVPFADAERVLKKLGHEATNAGDDHYVRTIRGASVNKVMVGYPDVPDDD